MSIYSYLKKDHDEVKSLFNEIEQLGAESSEKRTSLFNQVKKKLILHSKAEEKVFYNPLKKYAEAKDEVEHGEEEHTEAEQLLEELTDPTLSGAAWAQKFKKLKEEVEHHIKEEEEDIFTIARRLLSEETARQMEEDMKRLKSEIDQKRKIEPRQAA
ncbi:MAG: hemerythrin domain-containing protein [Alphaproteobacteria bacterium]|nr:hemerythrin domain-containing protein [Alphaproteobacteria bacterium]